MEPPPPGVSALPPAGRDRNEARGGGRSPRLTRRHSPEAPAAAPRILRRQRRATPPPRAAGPSGFSGARTASAVTAPGRGEAAGRERQCGAGGRARERRAGESWRSRRRCLLLSSAASGASACRERAARRRNRGAEAAVMRASGGGGSCALALTPGDPGDR